MLVIGLTGGIGSGKSTVAELFQQQGIPVIDTDEIARQLVAPGQPAYDEITSQFKNTVDNQNQIDRRKLREIVFNNPDKRKLLEDILHPRIQQAVTEQLAQLDSDYIIVVIPLLAEKGRWPFIDRVLVVDCEPALQLERAAKRDAAAKEQIRKIMEVQASREQRLALADDVIVNNAELAQVQQQVRNLDKHYRTIAKNTII